LHRSPSEAEHVRGRVLAQLVPADPRGEVRAAHRALPLRKRQQQIRPELERLVAGEAKRSALVSQLDLAQDRGVAQAREVPRAVDQALQVGLRHPSVVEPGAQAVRTLSPRRRGAREAAAAVEDGIVIGRLDLG
jgi:hypothetical protein